MNKKKVLWVVLLVVVVIAVIVFLVIAKPSENQTNNVSEQAFNKENTVVSDSQKQDNKEYIKKELNDGILYSVNGDEIKSDFVIGDNYFDTTINDMYYNPESYYNKNIEIEGMYLANLPYTFVGRYSTSNLCPNCPTGYSYLEYQLQGNIDYDFLDEQTWIKVIGTLAKGNDETSFNEDYYYLKVLSLEIMNEKGNDTVNN